MADSDLVAMKEVLSRAVASKIDEREGLKGKYRQLFLDAATAKKEVYDLDQAIAKLQRAINELGIP